MLRLAATWILEVYGYGEKMADHICEFFKIFVEPYWEESKMFAYRMQIRGNQHLNKLLFDNTNGLRSIFERYKTAANLFTSASAINIFGQLRHQDYQVNNEDIQE